MDRLTKEQRYKNMSANKGKGTKPELLFGKLLWNAGVRYLSYSLFRFCQQIVPNLHL